LGCTASDTYLVIPGLIAGYTAKLAAFAREKSLTQCMQQADIAEEILGAWRILISGYTAAGGAVNSQVERNRYAAARRTVTIGDLPSKSRGHLFR
jgi:hypothetical protein